NRLRNFFLNRLMLCFSGWTLTGDNNRTCWVGIVFHWTWHSFPSWYCTSYLVSYKKRPKTKNTVQGSYASLAWSNEEMGAALLLFYKRYCLYSWRFPKNCGRIG